MLTKIIIAIGVVYLLARSQAEKINYSVARSYVFKWGFDAVVVRSDIELKNDSRAPILVDNFLGELNYQGVKIADVGLISPIDVQSGQTKVFTVGAKILYGPTTAIILETIRTGRLERKINLKGKLYAGRLAIPVNTNIDL